MLWHEQTWPMIDAMDRQTPVLIALASCEQHGHHLPLYVDTIQVQTIAERVEQRLGDSVLLLPPLWLGCSDHHLAFAGTVSVGPSLYQAMIKQVARSVLNAGFKQLFFLNGHGGNLLPAATALTELITEDDRADAANMALGSWWDIAGDAMSADRHGMTTKKLTHACEYETSVMLALRDDLVRLDRLDADARDAKRRWTDHPGLMGFKTFSRVTAPGHMGEPAHATAAKGQSLLEAVVDRVAACVSDFATWPTMPVLGPRRES